VVDPQEFLDFYLDSQFEDIAGLKPLPINRMVRQAGRLKNRSPSGRGAGPMMFSRANSKRINLTPEEAQTLLRSDPQFAASYQRQVVDGEGENMRDKYRLYELHDGGMIGDQYKPYIAGDRIHRDQISRDDLNRMTIKRHQDVQDAINNWDPIEASAREDYNRLRGGMSAADRAGIAHEIIRTIDTPSNPGMSLGEMMFPTP
jgi:hypothetical protein